MFLSLGLGGIYLNFEFGMLTPFLQRGRRQPQTYTAIYEEHIKTSKSEAEDKKVLHIVIWGGSTTANGVVKVSRGTSYI